MSQELHIAQQFRPFSPIPRASGGAIELGRGTTLAKLVSRAGLWETEILSDRALAVPLSAAHGKSIGPEHRWVRATKSAMSLVQRGNQFGADEEFSSARFEAISEAGAGRLFEMQTLIRDGAEPEEALAKVCPSLALAKYDPNEPCDERGRWTDGDGASGGATRAPHRSPNQLPIVPASDKRNWADEADKDKFIDKNLAAAEAAAKKMGVPVEFILGLATSESSYGKNGRFATDGNNILSLHYPAPLATGYMLAGDGKTKVATFASTADCIASFAEKYGEKFKGMTEPEEFVTELQNMDAFGVQSNRGMTPSFVENAKADIQAVRVRLASRKI